MESTEKKNSISFTLLIVAIILGAALYKQFNFQTFKFEKPALAILYGVVFITSVFFLIKGAKGSNSSER